MDEGHIGHSIGAINIEIRNSRKTQLKIRVESFNRNVNINIKEANHETEPFFFFSFILVETFSKFI